MPLVSIVIPVYYNSASLPLLAERLNLMRAANPQYHFEFIYVDDGSGDDSYQKIVAQAENDADVKVLKLSRNFGSFAAITAGMQYAKGECLACIAADLQDPPETIPEMLKLWKAGYKSVLAVRKDRQGDPLITRLFANVFNKLYKRLVFNDFSPQGVGFFLIDRQVVNVILSSEEKNANLIGLVFWAGFKYATVPYERTKRIHGESKWTFPKKFKYFIDSFIAFSYLPIRLATLLGISLAIMGALYAGNIILARIFGQVAVEGWSALMVVLLLLSGVQLIILGIIGEYLWRNFDATRKRPMYIVESFYHRNQNDPAHEVSLQLGE